MYEPLVKITPQQITFQGRDNTTQKKGDAAKSNRKFKLEITNTSPKFLSFRIEAYLVGYERSEVHKWYSLTPRVCRKKPPGVTTEFEFTVEDSPIPGAEGEIPIVFKVSAFEDEKIWTKNDECSVKFEVQRYLSVSLLNPDPIYITPDDSDDRDPYELSILVQNLRNRSMDVDIEVKSGENEQSSEINENYQWSLTPKSSSSISLKANESRPIEFDVYPPRIEYTYIKKTYQFSIDFITKKGGFREGVKANFEVLPCGKITFDPSDRNRKVIQKFPDDRMPPEEFEDRFGMKFGDRLENDRVIGYEFSVKNQTNVNRELSLSLDLSSNAQSNKKLDCDFTIFPQRFALSPQKEQAVWVLANIRRRPIWSDKTSSCELRLSTSLEQARERNNITIEPNQSYRLTLANRAPIWWKILAVLALLVALSSIPVVRYFLAKRHLDTVNTVRLIDSGNRVVSGAKDGSIFRWRVAVSLVEQILQGGRNLIFRGSSYSDDAVRVIRERSRENSENVSIAVGLKNGEIQLWNLANLGEEPQRLYSDGDNIFDLLFSRDPRYLFSSHGSGTIRRWDLNAIEETGKPSPDKVLKVDTAAVYTIESASVLNSGIRRDLLFFGGQRNSFRVWELQSDASAELNEIDLADKSDGDRANNEINRNNVASRARARQSLGVVYDLSSFLIEESQSADSFKPIIGEHDYLTSITASDRLLVTADNQGYVRFWDMDALKQCLDSTNEGERRNYLGEGYSYRTVDCNSSLIRWQDSYHGGLPVRSVAVSYRDSCYYVASAGDDGQVILLSFKEDLLDFPDSSKPKLRKLQSYDRTQLNSVDIFIDSDLNQVLIANDADRGKVELHRHSLKNNANCQ